MKKSRFKHFFNQCKLDITFRLIETLNIFARDDGPANRGIYL